MGNDMKVSAADAAWATASSLVATEEGNSKIVKDGSLKGRTSINFRMVPAVLAVASCIIGLVAGIFMNHSMLMIASGVGLLSSLYLTYLAHQYKHLTNFSKNNEQLSGSITEFKKDLQKQEQVSKSLEANAAKYKRLYEGIVSVKGQLESQNLSLEEKIGLLTQEATRVKEANTQLENQVTQFTTLSTKQGEHLYKFATVLATLNETATNQKTNFGEQAGQLTSQLKQISQASHELSESREIMNGTMRTNIGNIETSATLLESLLGNVKEMLSSQATQERMNNLQTLHSQQSSLQSQIESGQTQLCELREQISREREKLSKLTTTFARHLETFEELTSTNAQQNAELRQQVAEGLAEFKNVAAQLSPEHKKTQGRTAYVGTAVRVRRGRLDFSGCPVTPPPAKCDKLSDAQTYSLNHKAVLVDV